MPAATASALDAMLRSMADEPRRSVTLDAVLILSVMAYSLLVIASASSLSKCASQFIEQWSEQIDRKCAGPRGDDRLHRHIRLQMDMRGRDVVRIEFDAQRVVTQSGLLVGELVRRISVLYRLQRFSLV